MVIKMFHEIEILIDDAIAMDAFYLEMRLTNDPDMSKHAEDYNLMVLEMVKGSQQRGGGGSALMGNGYHATQGNGF
jgi:hypothetical protein